MAVNESVVFLAQSRFSRLRRDARVLSQSRLLRNSPVGLSARTGSNMLVVQMLPRLDSLDSLKLLMS